MKITVVQPPYFVDNNPDQTIADFLLSELKNADSDLIVLPEYSNAGGISDKESLLSAIPRAEDMLNQASLTARQKCAFVAINVLQQRGGKIKNSTYLFDKNGDTAFIYDKIHLPPSEVSFGIERGNGECFCEVNGIKFAFLTCYDVYFNEQIEYIASKKPDIIIVPGYQRGERTDIILAQSKLLAFRANAFVARASVSMNSSDHGGCSLIASPDGNILKNIGADVGAITAEVDPKYKYMRPAGFGGGMVRNDDFINSGLMPNIFNK
ncbi:MAG: carbon-nitrogen hydrolase family protein [Clostridia bacterium]|nr:carbon-nitrogen hydrolase family protein [Clostridia bacterium]